MTEKKRKMRYRLIFIGAMVLAAAWLTACGAKDGGFAGTAVKSPQAADGNLRVHFIDVGQGDGALIEQDGHFMLIDAGESDQGDTVVSYLKSQGVKKLDYVIGTHPHSDHIGGLPEVIGEFDVDKVILPGKEHTTKTYERLLTAVEKKNLKVTVPKARDEFAVGDASFQIIAPNRDYDDDLNNWSVGIRVVYKNTSFVLCGDAEKESEEDMCANGLMLKADVLKLSHHGSSTASSETFIDRVDPEYVVISCGKNNDYGHPHKEVLELLNRKNIKALRTDELGTIVAVSDGGKISFEGVSGGDGFLSGEETAKETTQESAEALQYVINENTKKFHLPECKSVTSIKKENKKYESKSREELIDMGYEPCKSCNP